MPGLLHVGAVHVEDALAARCDRSINSGTDDLHAERHLVLGDARLRLGVGDFVELFLIEAGQRVEHAAARGGVDAGGIGQEQHRIAVGAQGDALVLARQETRAPKAVVDRLRCPGGRATMAVMTTNAGRFSFSVPRP